MRIVFLGDSITHGGNWQDWFPEFEAHNLGVPGDTTDDLIARAHEVVEASPDMVALLVGTNDLGTRRSVEHLVRNVEFLMVGLRRDLPGARLLVQSIMPRGREFSDAIQDANRHLRQFAPTLKAQYLDLWPAMSLTDGEIDPHFSDDRLHLNDAGYEAWLNELRPAIDRLRDAPPMTGSFTAIRVD